jgi:hypothetical protein
MKYSQPIYCGATRDGKCWDVYSYRRQCKIQRVDSALTHGALLARLRLIFGASSSYDLELAADPTSALHPGTEASDGSNSAY